MSDDRRYLEDFAVGQRFVMPGEYEMTLDEMTAYARKFDPQVITSTPTAHAPSSMAD